MEERKASSSKVTSSDCFIEATTPLDTTPPRSFQLSQYSSAEKSDESRGPEGSERHGSPPAALVFPSLDSISSDQTLNRWPRLRMQPRVANASSPLLLPPLPYLSEPQSPGRTPNIDLAPRPTCLCRRNPFFPTVLSMIPDPPCLEAESIESPRPTLSSVASIPYLVDSPAPAERPLRLQPRFRSSWSWVDVSGILHKYLEDCSTFYRIEDGPQGKAAVTLPPGIAKDGQ
jgi:hypothetical protein